MGLNESSVCDRKKACRSEFANFLNSQRCLEVYRNYKYLFCILYKATVLYLYCPVSTKQSTFRVHVTQDLRKSVLFSCKNKHFRSYNFFLKG
jgi:hypothetical protein